MAVGGEGPAIPAARRARFGSDLKPRLAAAVAMGGLALATAWVGGFIFALFWWLASIVVLWEWQRLVGGARLAERVATGEYLALVMDCTGQDALIWQERGAPLAGEHTREVLGQAGYDAATIERLEQAGVIATARP